MKLKLAEDLSFPLDAVTQTFLVVGKRGSGKSNTAARLVEQFYDAGLPFVVLDPVDTWWGLKASRDGGKGLDVYVFGGRKQDLPLEAGSGALIAEVLCEHRMPMVLSVKHLSGRERSTFMVAFAQTLFQKWGGGPLHVVLEEAHELAPQMSGAKSSSTDNEAAMLGAFKRLWKLGRSSGIGGTAVTQRPASSGATACRPASSRCSRPVRTPSTGQGFRSRRESISRCRSNGGGRSRRSRGCYENTHNMDGGDLSARRGPARAPEEGPRVDCAAWWDDRSAARGRACVDDGDSEGGGA